MPLRSPIATDAIDVADGASIPVEGVVTLGSSECLIVPSFPSMLLSQSFIEKSNLITIMIDKKLHLVERTAAISDLIDKQDLVISIDAVSGLYYISSDQLELLASRQRSAEIVTRVTGKNVSFSNPLIIPPSSSSFIAKYRTISFPTVKDLVLFWHKNLNHASETRMIAVVKNKFIANLPAQLTVAAIRKYFPKSPNPFMTVP